MEPKHLEDYETNSRGSIPGSDFQPSEPRGGAWLARVAPTGCHRCSWRVNDIEANLLPMIAG